MSEVAVPEPIPSIPVFEGAAVEATRLKIANSAVLDLPDQLLHVDDVVQVLVDCKVTSVTHMVDPSSGKLLRVQVAKPYDARVVPYNPSYDNGVDRA